MEFDWPKRESRQSVIDSGLVIKRKQRRLDSSRWQHIPDAGSWARNLSNR